MSSLPTTIVDPEKVAWKGEATQVILGIADGSVGILPGHAEAVFTLSPHIARIQSSSEKEEMIFISGGIARVEKGSLTILADTAEFAKKIDCDRAEKAKSRALERLANQNPNIDHDRARLALARALLRLDLAHSNR